jgi:hypothetical protein
LDRFIDSVGLMVLGNRRYVMTMGHIGKIMIEFQQTRAVTCGPMALYEANSNESQLIYPILGKSTPETTSQSFILIVGWIALQLNNSGHKSGHKTL